MIAASTCALLAGVHATTDEPCEPAAEAELCDEPLAGAARCDCDCAGVARCCDDAAEDWLETRARGSLSDWRRSTASGTALGAANCDSLSFLAELLWLEPGDVRGILGPASLLALHSAELSTVPVHRDGMLSC